MLAGLRDAPVAVETVCPETGETVSFEGTLEELESDAAVVSIGVANDPLVDADASADDDEAPPFSHVYDRSCPYVQAFASRDAYEAWRETVDAETTAISPAVALAAAKALAA